MRNILATFLIILMLLPVSAMGEILTIKHTVKQTFGGGQSPDDARISGIALAKREALEKAGTYIENLTVVKNYKVEKDEILALTAGVLKAEVVSQKNYASDDAFGIEIVVNGGYLCFGRKSEKTASRQRTPDTAQGYSKKRKGTPGKGCST
jgi:hypothetical protein